MPIAYELASDTYYGLGVVTNNFEWDQAKRRGDLGLLAATKVLITVR